MRLLISLYLPFLPLEALRPSWSEPGLYAVLDAAQVVAMSIPALRDGVRLGMRAGGVATISPETNLLERDPIKEQIAMQGVAMAMLQYTPEVRVDGGAGMLMDVGASLTLFGGAPALCRRIKASLAALGFTVRLGAAPTGLGAWILARSARRSGLPMRRRVMRLARLSARLDALPCHLLEESLEYSTWLKGIGVENIGGLRRLPRAALIRRTNKRLIADLDRAYGDAAEMFDWMRIPDTFSAHIETFDRIEHAEALMHGATVLVLQMTGWLTVQQLAVTMFTLWMEHERGRAAIPPTPLEIALAEPSWKEPHLLRLLKERLAKVELTAPVIGLRLDARQLTAMAPVTDSLFPEPGGSPADFRRLLELLTARLGPANVLTPNVEPDYRPEVYNAWVPAAEKLNKEREEYEAIARPFWILPKPIPLLMRDQRPFYGSPLKLIRGPERVEGGWWDDRTAARDYYVGQGADSACYWIYLERTQEAKWYLHGLYA